MNTEERFWKKCHEKNDTRERAVANHYLRGNEEYHVVAYTPTETRVKLSTLWLSGMETVLDEVDREWMKDGSLKVLDEETCDFWVSEDTEEFESRPRKSHG
ncbi:MAG TPA: hypothetical protein V6D17_18755 [Candidatus Obscuribacterales bacterium]